MRCSVPLSVVCVIQTVIMTIARTLCLADFILAVSGCDHDLNTLKILFTHGSD